MTRLPEPRASRAVLIGAARYVRADLPDLPSVAYNVTDLAELLSDPGRGILPADRCHLVTDPVLPHELGLSLSRLARSTEDTLIVYFSGHGLLDAQGELHLAMVDTDPDPELVRYTAFPYDWLRRELAGSPARNRIVVLDCCFSGRAIQAMASPTTLVAGQLEINGSYTLASAPGTSTAAAPTGRRHTAFTGELLDLLGTGVPEGPELLTLGELYRQLHGRLLTRGLPKPQARGTGLTDRLALGRNHAYRSSAPVEPQPVVAGRDRMAGTYSCRGALGAEYLCFLPSGEVLWVASLAPAAEVVRWLRPTGAGLLHGRYRLTEGELKCTVESPSGPVRYTGVVAERGRRLRLTVQDHRGHRTATQTWELVAAVEGDGGP